MASSKKSLPGEGRKYFPLEFSGRELDSGSCSGSVLGFLWRPATLSNMSGHTD